MPAVAAVCLRIATQAYARMHARQQSIEKTKHCYHRCLRTRVIYLSMYACMCTRAVAERASELRRTHRIRCEAQQQTTRDQACNQCMGATSRTVDVPADDFFDDDCVEESRLGGRAAPRTVSSGPIPQHFSCTLPQIPQFCRRTLT
jgi:hypothetical protein